MKPTTARLLLLAALLLSVCLPLGAHAPVNEKPHLGLNARETPSHQGFALANSLNAPGLDESLRQHRVRSRCTAKERDAESGLDYFEARYFSSSLGRFTSADEPLVDQYPEDPASWNLYKYVRNSPLRFSDPDGRTCAVNDDSSQGTIDDGGETCEQVTSDNATDDPEVEVVSGTVPLTDLPGQFFVGFGEFFFNQQPQGAVVAFNALAAGAGLESIAIASQTTSFTTLDRITPKVVGGRITGYTSHGINQVLGRNGGRGVSAKAVLEAVRNPTKIVEQANGTVKYVGAQATVILNQAGKVVTAWAKSSQWSRGPRQLVIGSGNAAQRAANARGFSFLPGAIR